VKDHDEPTTDEPLAGEEAAALAALRRDGVPPAAVEERVVEALRARGAFARRRPRWTLVLGYAAVLAIGLGAGRLWRPAPGALPAQPRFLLLLYQDVGFQEGGPAEQRARVREYGAWARGLARQGKLVSGEELRDDGQELRPSAASAALSPERLHGEPRGFFVVVAPDAAGAAAIAADCPHLRHGGRVVVRPIA